MTLLDSEEFYSMKNGTRFQVTQKGCDQARKWSQASSKYKTIFPVLLSLLKYTKNRS